MCSLSCNYFSTQHSITVASKTMDTLTEAAGFTLKERTTLTSMRSAFESYHVNYKTNPLDTDIVTKAFFDARHT